MQTLIRSNQRGQGEHGWLKSRHTFSFADYQDPRRMGFRSLRVMNEDWVQPGRGFGMHPHRDMEIITYILEGELQHRDSMGNGEVLRAGELQHMTAGSGIMHSEFNPSSTETVHLYQIWLLPREKGLKPTYRQTAFPEADRQGRFQLVASPDGAESSLLIQQDARLYLARLDDGQELNFPLSQDRHAWVQVLRGAAEVSGHSLQVEDGLTVSETEGLSFRSTAKDTEVLLFDLA